MTLTPGINNLFICNSNDPFLWPYISSLSAMNTLVQFLLPPTPPLCYFIFLSLLEQKRGQYYWLQVSKEEREMTCVSVSFLDFLGVSQALPSSVTTAEGVIFLLESTHPPAFPVTFELPNLRHRWEFPLLPHLHCSRSTSWTSLNSVIFTSCVLTCVSSSLPGVLHLPPTSCPPVLRTQSSHSEIHPKLHMSLSC